MGAEKTSSKGMERVISEEWKPIQGYEGFYEISNFGRVKCVERVGFQRHWRGGQSRYVFKERILKSNKRRNGYLYVTLQRNKTKKSFNIHRLVAIHFIPRVEGKDTVNHLDANPENNRVDNIVWCTQSENIQYAYDHGTKTPPHEKRIDQLDLDGNYIRTWKSQAEIERVLHIFKSNIHKVCIGKRNQTGGYKWRFTE